MSPKIDFLLKIDSGEKHVDIIGDVAYDLKTIKLTNLTLPEFKVSIVLNQGIAIVFSESTSRVSFDWNYSSWIISDRGNGYVSLSNTYLFLPIAVTQINGYPYLYTKSATVAIGKFDLHLSGGASWLYDIFIDLFQGEIRKSIEKSVSTALVKSIDTNANAVIKTFPLSQDIGCCVNLSYALTQNPTFATTYMAFDESGVFQAKNKPQPTPYPLNVLPDIINDEEIQIFISDYMLTSAGYAFWQSGQLIKVITPQDVPSSFPIQLNTTYFSQLIPALYNRVSMSKPFPLSCSILFQKKSILDFLWS